MVMPVNPTVLLVDVIWKASVRYGSMAVALLDMQYTHSVDVTVVFHTVVPANLTVNVDGGMYV